MKLESQRISQFGRVQRRSLLSEYNLTEWCLPIKIIKSAGISFKQFLAHSASSHVWWWYGTPFKRKHGAFHPTIEHCSSTFTKTCNAGRSEQGVPKGTCESETKIWSFGNFEHLFTFTRIVANLFVTGFFRAVLRPVITGPWNLLFHLSLEPIFTKVAAARVELACHSLPGGFSVWWEHCPLLLVAPWVCQKTRGSSMVVHLHPQLFLLGDSLATSCKCAWQLWRLGPWVGTERPDAVTVWWYWVVPLPHCIWSFIA